MEELGKLRRLDARKVWTHEARDFTPWLKENISLLGEALGLDLDLVEAEVPVGPFAADLVAKDVSNDRWVVIENQLEATDHGHLGQLLTYGAGTEAAVFVWISPQFREEHRAALDWLNEHTDEGSLFFGVVLELLAVDDSLPAPNFRLVSFPNAWRKSGGSTPKAVSKKGAAYAQFFADVLAVFKERYPGETNASKASADSWLGIGIGRTGLYTAWAFTIDRRFRVELYIDFGSASASRTFFDRQREDSQNIESELGHPFEWEDLEGKQACRISSYYPQSPISVLDDDSIIDPLKEWAVEEMKRLRGVLGPRVREYDPA